VVARSLKVWNFGAGCAWRAFQIQPFLPVLLLLYCEVRTSNAQLAHPSERSGRTLFDIAARSSVLWTQRRDPCSPSENLFLGKGSFLSLSCRLSDEQASDQSRKLIVPLIEADDSTGYVRTSSERSSTMLPETVANRPVPPVMMWVSVILRIGNTRTARPPVFVKIWSPFSAVHTAVPDAVSSDSLTVNCEVNVNRPRWVASPVATKSCTPFAGFGSMPCSFWPSTDVAAPRPSVSPNDDVGASGEPSPAQLDAKTQKPSTTRIALDPHDHAVCVATTWANRLEGRNVGHQKA
jgi:hypothetical protein